MSNAPIYVTRPTLPPLEDFVPYLEKIWENNILTNNGPFHQQLEAALCEYLGVNYISLFNNGTIALICALKALDLQGEVITTPYSFIATSHALLWNNLKPIFVDIEPHSFNIAPDKIKKAVTPDTTAILGVHCYGNPCDVDAIKKVADEHQLKVIYDAAHAFGVCNRQGSILNYGDLSVLSFHATKVFSTFEGGAIVCHTQAMKDKIDHLKNFGLVSETNVSYMGLNGKLNEVSAAFGLLQLQYVQQMILKRREKSLFYQTALQSVLGIELPVFNQQTQLNYSYFPIRVTAQYPMSRDELYEQLKSQNIYARKYFFPLLSTFPMYSHDNSLAVAEQISKEILCLPLYPELSVIEQQRIVDVVRMNLKL